MTPEAAFQDLVGDLDYPMMIMTTAVEGEKAGCLVGFATQCSIDPPRFIVCLSKRNRTYRVARAAETLAVHLPPEEAGDLVELFGGRTGDETDKLRRCQWRPGPGGAPILERCPNWFAGRVLDRSDAGDHVAFLLEPVEASRGGPVRPFPFSRAKRIEPGHEA